MLSPDGELLVRWAGDHQTPYGYARRWDLERNTLHILAPSRRELAQIELPEFQPSALSDRAEWLALLGEGGLAFYDLPSLRRVALVPPPPALDPGEVRLAAHGDFLQAVSGDTVHFYRRDGTKVCSLDKRTLPSGYTAGSYPGEDRWSMDGKRYSRYTGVERTEGERVRSLWLSTVVVGTCTREYSRFVEDAGRPEWSANHDWVAFVHRVANRAVLRVESTSTPEATETTLAPDRYDFTTAEGLTLGTTYVDHAPKRRLPLPGVTPEVVAPGPLEPCGGLLKKRTPSGRLVACDDAGPGRVVVVNGEREIALEGLDAVLPADAAASSGNGKVLFYRNAVWDLRSGKRVATFGDEVGTSVEFSTDRRFAVFTAVGSVQPAVQADEEAEPTGGYVVWDTEIDDPKRAHWFLETEDFAMKFAQHGARAISERWIYLEAQGLYDLEARRLLWALPGATVVAVSPDASRIAVGRWGESGDGIRVLDVESGRQVVMLEGVGGLRWLGRHHALTNDDAGRLQLLRAADWSAVATVGPGRYLGTIDEDQVVLFQQAERLGLLRVSDGRVVYQLHRLDGAPLTFGSDGKLFGDQETVDYFAALRGPGDARFAPLSPLGKDHPRRTPVDPLQGFFPPL